MAESFYEQLVLWCMQSKLTNSFGFSVNSCPSHKPLAPCFLSEQRDLLAECSFRVSQSSVFSLSSLQCRIAARWPRALAPSCALFFLGCHPFQTLFYPLKIIYKFPKERGPFFCCSFYSHFQLLRSSQFVIHQR